MSRPSHDFTLSDSSFSPAGRPFEKNRIAELVRAIVACGHFVARADQRRVVNEGAQ